MRDFTFHMIIITTSRFDLFLRHDRMVTSKDTTLTTHSSVAHTYYIMSHQELDETSWLIFIQQKYVVYTNSEPFCPDTAV